MERLDVADELAIRDLVARYADAVNVADAGAWGANWAESAVWHLGPSTVEGRQSIVDFWRTAMATFESVVQLVAHGTVWADGDGAAGRWAIWEVGRREGAGTFVVGSYEDRYTNESGEWLFAERRFSAGYRGEVVAGEFFPFPPLA